MNRRSRIPTPPRERRSHAERTAETRERVMAAVVESIAELGYPKTTAAEIARRAGVTWGGVQHHFGDKDGILLAVLERSFNRFAELLGEAPDASKSLEARVSLFVERAWEHFASPHYRSTFEILRNLPDDLELTWQAEMLKNWFQIWSAYFPESEPSRRRTVDLMHYTISTLSGLATLRTLERTHHSTRELGYLKTTLVRELPT